MIREIARWWKWLSSGWHVLLEPPVPAEELNQSLARSSVPAFSFYFLLTLSAIIATLGLLADSAATIIGAMIVAPLMGPIVTIAYSLVSLEYRLLRRAILTLITGMALVIVISLVTTLVIGSRVAGDEIVARINPTLLDLGVAISAGAAGAFALTRKSIANALPGVAISVALVPPLCVTGIGLALRNQISAGLGLTFGQSNLIAGAFLLFCTNLTGIIVSGSLVFLGQHYGNTRLALMRLCIPIIALAGLSYPLGFSLNKLLLKNQLYHELQAIKHSQPELFADVRGVTWKIEFCEQPHQKCERDLNIELDLIAPAGFMNETRLKKLKTVLTSKVNTSMRIKVRVIPIEVSEIDVLSP
ncbi:DUF389 domain-containing protein [Acaryochloris marina]|uniref:DUF389 domain-containing protein n=1 Tax=Acaryochloris marina TaxID=155978 RepID=UPI0021C3507C|nr:DUF389 domain-containing protein [Acaryochloris marina]BDM83357.1 hypothetical protein AM10699_62180 [Acaryochloris marina MBIC10699]